MTKPFVYQMKRQDKIEALSRAATDLSQAPELYRGWLSDWRDAVEVPGWRWSGCRTEPDAVALARLRANGEYDNTRHPHRSNWSDLLLACAGPQASDYVGNDAVLLFGAFEGWAGILSANYEKYRRRLTELHRCGVGLENDIDSFSWGVFRPAAHAMIGVRMLSRWLCTPSGQNWIRGYDAVSAHNDALVVRVTYPMSRLMRPIIALWSCVSLDPSTGVRTVLASEDASELMHHFGWTRIVPYFAKYGLHASALFTGVSVFINTRDTSNPPKIDVPSFYAHKQWVEIAAALYRLTRGLELWLDAWPDCASPLLDLNLHMFDVPWDLK